MPTPNPPDQVIVPPTQPVAVSVALSVPHTVVLLDEITGADGAGPLLMVIEFDTAELPHELTQVAVYVPTPTSFVDPVPNVPDQVIVPPAHPVAVSVALSVPQIMVLFAEITGATGDGLVPIVIVFEFPEVPQLVVQVAVYVPAPTSLLVPTPNPADQVIVPPTQPVAVSVALSVPHTVVLLDVITGATGAGPLLIVIEFDTAELPHELTHVAV